MAVRRRTVEADLEVQTQTHGAVPVVSREAVMEAVADFVAASDIMGGIFSVLSIRHPLDLPNEMVTTQVIIEWRDRTDAKSQPELAAPKPEKPFVPEPEDLEAPAAQLDLDANPDGFPLDELPDEDIAEIPEKARA